MCFETKTIQLASHLLQPNVHKIFRIKLWGKNTYPIISTLNVTNNFVKYAHSFVYFIIDK